MPWRTCWANEARARAKTKRALATAKARRAKARKTRSQMTAPKRDQAQFCRNGPDVDVDIGRPLS